MRSIITHLFFGLAMSFGVLVSVATFAENKSSQPQNVVLQPENLKVSPVTQTALNAGIFACTGRINQIANFLTIGSQDVGVMLFIPPYNPDQQLVSISMEVPAKDSSVYASASFAPQQANGCGGMYETVVYWDQKCAEVADKGFGTLPKTGIFSKNITVLDGGPATKVFLLPAGPGCVSIKKEVVK